MHFVQFTLNPPAAVVAAAFGSFSAGRAQEVVVARQGGALELLRPDEATGRLAIDEAAEEAKLKLDMCCPWTGLPLKNMPAVKAHVASAAYRRGAWELEDGMNE